MFELDQSECDGSLASGLMENRSELESLSSGELIEVVLELAQECDEWYSLVKEWRELMEDFQSQVKRIDAEREGLHERTLEIAITKALDAGKRMQQSAHARRGARARLAADPRQADKAFVRSCWEKWRELPAKYKSKAAFARDMLDKCSHLESQKKIEDWCREWEASTQPVR